MSTALEHLKGKYEILEKLQEGGMGAVYKVRHRLLDEVRVIKVVRPQFKRDEEVKARFLREARTVIRLRHPNIAQLYDFSIDADENAFIVMEFIDGVTFLELLRRARVLPVPLVLEISRQSLEALRYLHRRSIVHRDIAPDNLMLTRDEDGSPLVKLIDLGVAKALEGGSSFTVAGTFLGKVRYASPEQFRSQEGVQVEPRSDLYSFGVVLYQLLTGALPVRGSSLSSLIAGHLLEPPIPFSETDPEGRVPEDLRQLVLHALAKKPEDRPASAGAFIHAIEAIQQRFPLDQAEVERLLAVPDLPTTKISVVKPGSTQDRLDQQFQLVATALPKERPDWVDVRLQSDEAAAPASVADHADAAAAAVDAAAPVADAPTMATPLPGVLAPAAFEPPPAAGEEPALDASPPSPPGWVEELIGEVEGLLSGGDAAGARRALDQAAEGASAYSAVVRLEKKVEESEREQRRRQAAALLVEARVALGMDDQDGARRHLDEVLRLDPENSEATRLLAQVKRHQEERRTQPTMVAKTLTQAHDALAAGKIDEAERIAERLETSLQAREDAAGLRSAIAEARTKQREEQVAELLRRARRAAESSQFEEAEASLEEALHLNPNDTLIGSVLASTRRAREEYERRLRQERAVASVTQRIEVLLQAEELEEARAVLAEAITRLGAHESLALLKRRLEVLAAEAAAWSAARAAVAEARELLKAGRGTQALARFEKAKEAAEGFPEVIAFVGEEEQLARTKLESSRRDREVTEACRRVEGLLAGGQVEEAARALALAEKLFPRQGELLVLRQQLEGALRERRAGACAEVAARARELAAAGKFEPAIRMVNEALAANPDFREACAPLLDELRRKEAVYAVSSCLARGDRAGARRALALAEKMFPVEPQLAVLRQQLDDQ